eukprot:jgi/Chrzof1/7755/Cz02g35170.t1
MLSKYANRQHCPVIGPRHHTKQVLTRLQQQIVACNKEPGSHAAASQHHHYAAPLLPACHCTHCFNLSTYQPPAAAAAAYSLGNPQQPLQCPELASRHTLQSKASLRVTLNHASPSGTPVISKQPGDSSRPCSSTAVQQSQFSCDSKDELTALLARLVQEQPNPSSTPTSCRATERPVSSCLGTAKAANSPERHRISAVHCSTQVASSVSTFSSATSVATGIKHMQSLHSNMACRPVTPHITTPYKPGTVHVPAALKTNSKTAAASAAAASAPAPASNHSNHPMLSRDHNPKCTSSTRIAASSSCVSTAAASPSRPGTAAVPRPGSAAAALILRCMHAADSKTQTPEHASASHVINTAKQSAQTHTACLSAGVQPTCSTARITSAAAAAQAISIPKPDSSGHHKPSRHDTGAGHLSISVPSEDTSSVHPDGNAEVITESSHTSIFGEDSALQHQSMGNGGTAAAQSPTALQDEHLPGINGHTDLLQRDSAVCNATPKHPCFSTSAANAIATPAAVHSHLATSAADSRPATSALLKALLAQLTADSSSKPATAMPGASTVLTRPATSAQAGPQQHRPATSALRALLTTAAGSDGVEEALRCIRLMYGEDDQHADLVIVNEEDDDKASVATAAGVRQAAPMVLNLEDPMQSTAEVLEMEMEALGLEQLKLLRDALYSSTNK